MLNKPINFIKRLNIKKIFILLTRVFKFSRKKGVSYEKYTILTFISKNKIMPVRPKNIGTWGSNTNMVNNYMHLKCNY